VTWDDMAGDPRATFAHPPGECSRGSAAITTTMGDDIGTLLHRAGLTRYEIQAYLALTRRTVESAARLSEESGVPRTKLYGVLASLQGKGWVTILSGQPLLYRAVPPDGVVERLRQGHESLLAELQAGLADEAVTGMHEIVVLNRGAGIEGLRGALRKADQVCLSMLTWSFYEQLREDLAAAGRVKAVFFPGEAPPRPRPNEEFRIAPVRVVHVVDGEKSPAMQAIVDDSRLFTIVWNPFSKRHEVDEMFFSECVGCLKQAFELSWDGGRSAPSSSMPSAQR